MQEDYQNLENNKETEESRPAVHSAPLNRGQKIAVAILAIFAVAVIVVWMVQFKKSITGPFDYNDNSADNNAETRRAASLQEEEQDSEEALRSKDTDADGLSDWDELYFYKTSPYLDDSDSDGFTDKEELDSGNDPNCPIGRECYASDISPMNPPETDSAGDLNLQNNNSNNNISGGLLSQPVAGDEGGQTDGSADLEAILGGQLDAATLRQILLDAGMDEKILNQFSDEELMKEWGKTFSGAL